MDEIQAPTLHIEEEEEKIINEDFYENIEAPKFVDLSAPDRHRQLHDDRYWFCLRVGCDQKHEEEMDSEKIYKDFVLRVMAARSPNIRLRKAMYRQENSKNLKCPRTVPAKPSKSRISRLAMISSINRKIVDAKTPNVKTKQSAVVQAKAMTTPRCKKRLSNPNAFRSVRNPKPTGIDMPKNKGIAKALVFHSPKKTFKIKTSVELRSSVKKLCSEMKKLEIASGKKQLFPKEASRKQLRGREVKSRVFDSLHSQNHKRKKEAESSDMEVGTKSKNMIACLKKKHEDIVEALSESSRKIVNSSPSFDEKNSSKDVGFTGEGSLKKEKISKIIEKEDKGNLLTTTDDDKTNVGEKSDNKENCSATDEKTNVEEVLESDDKENCSASDENRQPNLHHRPAEEKKKINGKRENFKSIQKVSRVTGKTAKENTNDAQIVKHRKTKLTTPKPFRFRTDERGILKEASEKKTPHVPVGETAETHINNQPQKVGTSSGLKSSKQQVLMKKRETPPGKSIASLVKPGQQLGAIEENSEQNTKT